MQDVRRLAIVTALVVGAGAVLGAAALYRHGGDGTSPQPLAFGIPPEQAAEASLITPPHPVTASDPDVQVVRVTAAAFVPQTLAALAETTAGPAVVRIVGEARVDAQGYSRRQLTAEQAEEINRTRPASSVRPPVKEGDWVGGVTFVSTLYDAEVRWLDPARPAERMGLRFPGGKFEDLFMVVDDMPLPEVGSEYLLFLTVGDDWATPAYVQFKLEDGRLAPQMHNDSGIGKELLGLSASDVWESAKSVPFLNNGMAVARP